MTVRKTKTVVDLESGGDLIMERCVMLICIFLFGPLSLQAEQDRPKRLPPDQREEYEARMEKYYFSGNWYGQASCGIIYILAISLERADNDLLWCFAPFTSCVLFTHLLDTG